MKVFFDSTIHCRLDRTSVIHLYRPLYFGLQTSKSSLANVKTQKSLWAALPVCSFG